MSNKAIYKKNLCLDLSFTTKLQHDWINVPNFKCCIFILPRKPQEFSWVAFSSFKTIWKWNQIEFFAYSFHFPHLYFLTGFWYWHSNFYNPSRRVNEYFFPCSINKCLKEAYAVRESVSKHSELSFLKWLSVCNASWFDFLSCTVKTSHGGVDGWTLEVTIFSLTGLFWVWCL